MTQSRPPCCSTIDDCVERRFELIQLAIDRNSNRLEGLRRRMLFRALRSTAPAPPLDDSGKLHALSRSAHLRAQPQSRGRFALRVVSSP